MSNHPIDIAELRRLLSLRPDHFIAEGESLQWLIEQTLRWPERVHPERTTNDTFLRFSMAATMLALLDRIETERSAIVAYIRAEASRCYAAGTGCLADAVTAEGDALTAIAAEIEVGNHLPAAPTPGGANA